MNYEVVELKEKTVAGIEVKTNNQMPNMKQTIGRLWQRFFEEGYGDRLLEGKYRKVMGIYTDYESDHTGDYHAMVACEVEEGKELPEGAVIKHFPAGKFARFIIKGDRQQAVGQFWERIWEMKLERTFIYDFEEYQDDHAEDAEVHIYIGIR